ncbi:MAG: hypothetical protein GXP08_10405 [Gammaproteobacteria bacterium]|nr:hypothetical protein [Gammaproteobacteria bacterium]
MNMIDNKFEPLKKMAAFTDDMFNRIIAFQEKEHAAWNTTLDFDKRIEGLPLHNLIFSNPDRDPKKFAATVAAFYPLRVENQKLAAYAKQVAQHPVIIDWYPGNGFIGSLLAREGVDVKGINNNNLHPNQIPSLFDAHCYEFCDDTTIEENCDMVLASWMPSNRNPTADILHFTPKIISYIYTDHINDATGERQTGTHDMFTLLEENYTLTEQWITQRPTNLLHEVWPDMTPSIEETRITRVYARHDITLDKPDTSTPDAPYDWEKELRMALLALEAKQLLRSQGVSIT